MNDRISKKKQNRVSGKQSIIQMTVWIFSSIERESLSDKSFVAVAYVTQRYYMYILMDTRHKCRRSFVFLN